MDPQIGTVPVTHVSRIGEEIAEGIELFEGVVLIGSWKEGKKGCYEPSETGDYSAAILNETVYVCRSKYHIRTPTGELQYILPPEISGD